MTMISSPRRTSGLRDHPLRDHRDLEVEAPLKVDGGLLDLAGDPGVTDSDLRRGLCGLMPQAHLAGSNTSCFSAMTPIDGQRPSGFLCGFLGSAWAHQALSGEAALPSLCALHATTA